MDLVFCSAKLGGVSKSGEHPQSNSMRTFLKLVYFTLETEARLLCCLCYQYGLPALFCLSVSTKSLRRQRGVIAVNSSPTSNTLKSWVLRSRGGSVTLKTWRSRYRGPYLFTESPRWDIASLVFYISCIYFVFAEEQCLTLVPLL